MNVVDLFDDLCEKNKYLITICNTIDNSWQIYMFKNSHIQLDIQTPNSLSSMRIDSAKIVEYINNQNSDIKISYKCCYDDFQEYSKDIDDILSKIKNHYATVGKIIHTKCKMYW